MTAGRDALLRGDAAGAATQWEDAVRGSVAAGQPGREVDARVLLASAYRQLGHATDAIATLTEALRVATKLGDARRVAIARDALGAACSFTESASAAELLLRRALEDARACGDVALEASVQNNLGSLLAGRRSPPPVSDDELPDLKNYDAALTAYDAAAALAERARDPGLRAQCLVNKAAAAVHNGVEEDAVEFVGVAAPVVSSLPEAVTKARLLLTLGQCDAAALAAGVGDVSKLLARANASFEQALSLATLSHDDVTGSFALGYRAALYERRGRVDEALVLTRRAMFAAQQAQLTDCLYRWQWQTGRLLKAKGDVGGAIEAYTRAQTSLKDVRNDLALRYGNPNMRSSFREQAGGVYYGLADLLLQRAASVGGDQAGALRDMTAARDTIELLKSAELEDYFQDKCAHYYKSQQQDVDRAAHDWQAAIVYLVPLPDRTELLVTLPDGLHRFRADVTEAKLTASVRELRDGLERRTTNEYMVPSRRIYQWLIAPLEAELERQHVQTLVFVPDGALRTIPMASLNDGHGKFLIEKYALAVTPGLTLMQPKAIARGPVVTVLGNGLTEAKDGYPALRYVHQELTGIQAMYPGVSLMDRTFTSENLRVRMRDEPYTIVHIASHGQFTADSRQSFVLTYDGRLDLHDLEMLIEPAKFRGKPVEMLMLSACQTAKGDDRAALGLAGVAVKAGARSAVATLWSVNDEAAATLVEEFYRQLHSDPKASRAEALRRAQRKLIDNRKFAHPAYWSPFLLIGNWL